MEKEAKLIEVRGKHGELILSFYLMVKPIEGIPREPKNNPAQTGEGKPRDDEPKMTDPQKRYLFRILAEQGKEEEEAHKHLKELFQVESLKEVTKLEASKMIERLLNELKGGEVDAGIPF